MIHIAVCLTTWGSTVSEASSRGCLVELPSPKLRGAVYMASRGRYITGVGSTVIGVEYDERWRPPGSEIPLGRSQNVCLDYLLVVLRMPYYAGS